MEHHDLPGLGAGGEVVGDPLELYRARRVARVLVHDRDVDRAVVERPIAPPDPGVGEVLREQDRARVLVVPHARLVGQVGERRPDVRVGRAEELVGPVGLVVARADEIAHEQRERLVRGVGRERRDHRGRDLVVRSGVGPGVAVGQELELLRVRRGRRDEGPGVGVAARRHAVVILRGRPQATDGVDVLVVGPVLVVLGTPRGVVGVRAPLDRRGGRGAELPEHLHLRRIAGVNEVRLLLHDIGEDGLRALGPGDGCGQRAGRPSCVVVPYQGNSSTARGPPSAAVKRKCGERSR